MKIFYALAIGVLIMPINALDEKRIVIVAASYNNRAWYANHLDSIFSQNYHNFHLIYIDDHSSDGTARLVRRYIQNHQIAHRVTLIENEHRMGALANQYNAIHLCNDRDIIIILDGDDWFYHTRVLAYINDIYTKEDVWLTYGQFIEYPSLHHGFCIPTKKEHIEKNSCRYEASGFSHLRTFYAGLYKKIKIEDLFFNGQFFFVNADMATMLPMVEMAGYHIRFIPDILMVYNKANVLNDYKVNLPLVDVCGQEIRRRPVYDKIETPF